MPFRGTEIIRKQSKPANHLNIFVRRYSYADGDATVGCVERKRKSLQHYIRVLSLKHYIHPLHLKVNKRSP